jgi:uncharacterized membrane protein YphA (DoxX/SURF4 family)
MGNSWVVFQAIAWAITGIFVASALVNLAAPAFVKEAYARWQLPPKFYRVTGGLELLAALMLASPFTRLWGAFLAAMITFSAVLVLLNHRQYAYSVPGMLLLVALVPVARTGLF